MQKAGRGVDRDRRTGARRRRAGQRGAGQRGACLGAVLRRRPAEAALLLALLVPLPARADGPPSVTILAGRSYRFDPSVFEGGVVETGRVGSALLELAWPEMRGLTRGEAAAWPRRDTIRILANSGAAVDGSALPDESLKQSLPQLLSAALWSTIAPSGNRDPVVRDTSPLPSIPAAAPGPGMVRVVSFKSPSGTKDDVYVLDPISHVTEFVACGTNDAMRIDPSCAQTFVSDNLVFRVSYRRPLVVTWRAIHDRVIEFFRTAEVSR